MRVRLLHAAGLALLVGVPASAGGAASRPSRGHSAGGSTPSDVPVPSAARGVIDLYPATDSVFATPSVRLSWHAAERAVRYRVQLAGDGDFKSIDLDRTTADLSAQAGPLRPGHYYFRVASIDKRGTAAAWSNTNEIEIRGGDAAGNATLHWRPAAWAAAKFVVKIWRDKNMAGTPLQQTTTTEAFWTTAPLPKGVYYWRVETLDEDGKRLDLSPPWTFSVREGGIVDYEVR